LSYNSLNIVNQSENKVTMITSANILATSFEVPRTSPVAHVKFFLATNAIIIPDNNPMVIPIIPNMLRVKNPTAEAKICRS